MNKFLPFSYFVFFRWKNGYNCRNCKRKEAGSRLTWIKKTVKIRENKVSIVIIPLKQKIDYFLL